MIRVRPLALLLLTCRGTSKPALPGALLAAGAEPEADLDAIIDERPPRIITMTGYAMVAMLVVLTIVSATVKLDVVVQGSGELTMDSPPIVLQPLERAIIRSIKVKPGDTVAKGQVLASLDPTFVDADISALEAQKAAIGSHIRRLEAEAKGLPFGEDGTPPTNDASQAAIFIQRQEQYNSRIRAFDAEIRRMEAVSRGFEHDQEFLVQQLSIASEVERMRHDLNQLQYTSKLQLLESQSLRLRAERDRRDAENREKETSHALESKKAERQAFKDEWRRNILEELDRLQMEMSKIDEVITKAGRMRQLVDVTAPEDGVVLEVASRSAGSVAREAEPLMTLVPANGTIIAEVLIQSRDIGYAKAGDEVRVKVDAFPYQRHGMLHGILRSVSEGSYSVPPATSGSREAGLTVKGSGGSAMHRARIELTKSSHLRLPDGVRLTPGMTVSAEIMIGTRSVLSYFFEPIRRGFDEGLREPS